MAKKMKMLVELRYDASIMHGRDKEAKDWFFNEILKKDKLILHSNEIGDEIGIIKVLEVLA